MCQVQAYSVVQCSSNVLSVVFHQPSVECDASGVVRVLLPAVVFQVRSAVKCKSSVSVFLPPFVRVVGVHSAITDALSKFSACGVQPIECQVRFAWCQVQFLCSSSAWCQCGCGLFFSAWCALRRPTNCQTNVVRQTVKCDYRSTSTSTANSQRLSLWYGVLSVTWCHAKRSVPSNDSSFDWSSVLLA